MNPQEHTQAAMLAVGSLEAIPADPDTPQGNVVFLMNDTPGRKRGPYMLDENGEWKPLFTQTQVAQISGRWYAEPTVNGANQWVTFPIAYGAATENYTQSAGTDAEPVVNWAYVGPILSQGSKLTGIRIGARSSQAQVTGYDIRVIVASGPWGVWNAHGETVWDVVYSADGLPLPDTGWQRHSTEFTPFICPDDAFLLVFIRPVGTISARRYIHSAIGVEYEMT